MSDITIVGNIGEPELHFTPSGKAVLNVSLAENHSRKQGNEWVDDGTTWRRLVAWEQKAETLAAVLQKGDRVIVLGSERLKEFDTKDGSKGKSLEVVVKTLGVVPKVQPQGDPVGASGQATAQNSGWGQQSDPWQSSQPTNQWGGQ